MNFRSEMALGFFPARIGNHAERCVVNGAGRMDDAVNRPKTLPRLRKNLGHLQFVRNVSAKNENLGAKLGERLYLANFESHGIVLRRGCQYLFPRVLVRQARTTDENEFGLDLPRQFVGKNEAEVAESTGDQINAAGSQARWPFTLRKRATFVG